MTPEEFFEKLGKEKPENQSLQRYLSRHPRKEHSRGFLIEVARYVNWCKRQNKLPNEAVRNALKPYFLFLRR